MIFPRKYIFIYASKITEQKLSMIGPITIRRVVEAIKGGGGRAKPQGLMSSQAVITNVLRLNF